MLFLLWAFSFLLKFLQVLGFSFTPFTGTGAVLHCKEVNCDSGLYKY